MIVADIHTHPADWVDLSVVDREHPIEYRVGLVALVLPWFAKGPPEINVVGVHEYAGNGEWRTFAADEVPKRLHFVPEEVVE